MAKTYANVRDEVESVLQDTSNAIWDTTELDYLIDNCLYEISEYVPLEAIETVHARDNSFEVDISGIDGLLEIDKAEWGLNWDDDKTSTRYRRPYSKNPPQYRNVTKLSGSRAMLHLDSRPSAHEDDTLTGTVTFADGSKAITGSGTAFLSELEVGDYIRKSSGTEWYRVFAIASDTALTLARGVITAEDGADSASVTKYWHSPVWLHCWKVHRLNKMTTLTGAVDLGAGYAARVKTIHIDTLQTSGTIAKGTKFTFDTIDGVYTVTADATIGTSECDISFYPGLSAAIADGDGLTFETSTLNPEEERLLVELVAARASINWLGSGRTEIANAIKAVNSGAAAIGSMAARIGQAVTDVASSRTEAAKILTAVTLANASVDSMTASITQALLDIGSGRTEADKVPDVITEASAKTDSMAARVTQAIADIASGRTEADKTVALVTSANTAIGLMNNEVDKAANSLAIGQSYINQISRGENPEGQHLQYAGRFIEVARGYFAEASGYLTQANSDESVARTYSTLASGELQAALAHLNESQAFLREASAENAAAASYASLAAGELHAASQFLQQAGGYLREASADAVSSRAYIGVGTAELKLARESLNEAIGYLRESTSRLNVSRIISSYQGWGQAKLKEVTQGLQRIATPRQQILYSRS